MKPLYCYQVCTIITYQTRPLPNLCQIPDNAPKLTLLLWRFSVYQLLPLHTIAGCWLLRFLDWKNNPPRTANNLHGDLQRDLDCSPSEASDGEYPAPSSHCYSAGFLCIPYCLCAYHCWCWLLRLWLGKISPQRQQ